MSTRVAVVGARGIGKHHAKWWALEGAEVCAIVGTSEASVAASVEGVRQLFPFEGRGYADLSKMLATEKPDIVDVCSPPACHFDHARTALEAGCHVLCEKPFVFDPARSRDELLEQAHSLLELAERGERRFGLCTQYVVAAHICLKHWKAIRPDAPITRYVGHVMSPAKGRAPDPRRVWIDLGPHVISVLRSIASFGEIQWETLRTRFEGYQAQASFLVEREEGPLTCELIVGNTTEPPPNIRRIELDGYLFDIGGTTDAEGVYCTQIETADGPITEPDLMRLLIRLFLKGKPIDAPELALMDLDRLLRIMEIAGNGN